MDRDKLLPLITNMEPFIRVFVTSGHIDLQLKFTNIFEVEILARPSDIEAYLEFEINSNNRLSLFTAKDPKLKEDIIQSINEKAAGM